MAQAATAAVDDDEYGLEPAKPPAAAGVTDEQYGLEPAKKPAMPPGSFQQRKGGPVLNADKLGVQGKSKSDVIKQMQPPAPAPTVGSVAREGALGLASGFTGMPETSTPLTDFGKGLESQQQERMAHPIKTFAKEVLLGPAPQIADIAGGLGESGLEIGKGIYHLNPEEVAHGGGRLIGQLGQLGVLREAPEAVGKPSAVGAKVAEMRQPARVGNFMDVLRELTGKKPADLEFTRRAQTVLPDIAKVARDSGFEEKGNARVGEFKEMLDQRGRDIWQEEHKPQVSRHTDMPIDHEAVAQRARAAISEQARANNPAGARAADRWIQSALNNDSIGTIGKADDMMRHINAEIPNLPEPFKNIGKTVRNAAGEAIRSELESKLQATGEEGVSNPNSRWGALKEISTLLDAHLNNAANAPLKAWDVAGRALKRGYYGARDVGALGAGLGYLAGSPGEGFAVGAPIGAAAGVGASLAEDLLSQPGGRIARAMRGLGKTNLQPDTVQTPGFITNPKTSLVPGIGGPGNPVPPPPQTPVSSILPVPQRPVGTLPTLSGPVTNQMWGTPEVQPKPGFEAPQTEMLGPWGTGTPPPEPPPTVAPMKPPAEPTGKPPETAPERRSMTRGNFGPDFTRTALMNDLRKNIAAETDPEVKKTLEDRLADMKANPFEKHEGEADINRIKAMNKPTMTREEAEAATEARKTGRNQRFGSEREGILPGMGEHVEKQAEGAAKVKGEDLTREANTPRDVDQAAARMGTMSPLFRGTEASPQNEMFKPGGEPVKPMVPPNEPSNVASIKMMITKADEAALRERGYSQAEIDRMKPEEAGKILSTKQEVTPMEKPKVEEPEEGTEFKFGANAPEEEPEETHIKGITAKEKPPAKAKAVPVEKRFEPEEIERAELLIRQDLSAMQSMDKPGRYFDESEERNGILTQNQKAGERMGGAWRGVKSGRNMLPFFKENPKFTPAAVEKALRNKDSAMYQKMIERAVNLDRRETLSPEEIEDVERKRPSAPLEKPGISAADFVRSMKKPAAD